MELRSSESHFKGMKKSPDFLCSEPFFILIYLFSFEDVIFDAAKGDPAQSPWPLSHF